MMMESLGKAIIRFLELAKQRHILIATDLRDGSRHPVTITVRSL